MRAEIERPTEVREAYVGPELSEELVSHITLFALVVLFTLLALGIYFELIPRGLIYASLVFWAVVFLAFELLLWRLEPGRVWRAVWVGVFLMLLDFMVQMTGWLFGLWSVGGSMFQIGAVPIEIMLITLLGGTAWALYLPRSFDRLHTLMDILVFATYGTLGEHLLRIAGLMVYKQWWGWPHAFAAYALTWMILHYFRYRVVRV